MRKLVLVLLPVLAGCVDHKAIYTAGSMRMATQMCSTYGTCYGLGRHYARLSQESMVLDWDEPKDPAKARAAWALGCQQGEGESCRAIVEQKMYRDAREEKLYRLRAAHYRKPPRTPEEIAAELSEARAKVAEQNREIIERNRREDEENRRIAVGVTQAVVNTTQQIADDVKRRQGGGAAGGALGGMAGKADPCAPCAGHAAKLKAACADPQSPGCYCAAAAMHACTASAPGCVKNPAAAQQEASRMRRASCDMSRTGSSPCGCH